MRNILNNVQLVLLLCFVSVQLSAQEHDELNKNPIEFEFMDYRAVNYYDSGYLLNGIGDTLLKAERILPIISYEFVITEFEEYFDRQIVHEIPVIQVRTNDNIRLYDIVKKQFITQELSSNDLSFEVYYSNENRDFAITYSDGIASGIYSSKMEFGTQMFMVEPAFHFENAFVTYGKQGDSVRYLAKSNSPEDIMYAAEGFVASEDTTYTLNELEEWIPIRSYHLDFFITISGNDFGLLTFDNNYLVPLYTSIVQSLYDEILHIEKDGKFGVLNIRTNQIIEPFSDSMCTIIKTRVPPYFYVPVTIQGHYKGLDGNTYYNTVGNYYFGENNDEELGLFYYDDFRKDTFFIKSEYNSIEETEWNELYKATNEQGKCALISPLGYQLTDFDYTDFWDYSIDAPFELIGPGLMTIKGKKRGFYTTKKGKILEPVWDDISSLYLLNNEYGLIVYQGKKVGLMSLEGDTILPPEYDWIYLASEETELYNSKDIAASKKGLIGIYTSKGEEVIAPLYEWISPTEEFLGIRSDNYVVSLKKKYGLIDKTGKELLAPIYDDIIFIEDHISFKNPEFICVEVRKGKKHGVFNFRKGWIIPLEFDYVTYFHQEYPVQGQLFEVQKGKYYGAFDGNGNYLLECIFKDGIQIDESQVCSEYSPYVFAEKDGKIYSNTINETGNEEFISFKLENGYDLVSRNIGYRKTKEGWIAVDLCTNENVGKYALGNAEFKGEEFILFEKDGKFGAKDFDGKILIEPIYENGSFMSNRPEVMIGFEEGVKYYIYVFGGERYKENEW